jgi:hypothetical protein
MNLILEPDGEVVLSGISNCPDAGTLTSRDSCQEVGLIDGVQSAHDLGLVAGAAAKSASVPACANVHQNVHQRIKKDRIGYVRIRLDFFCKFHIISMLHSASDPLPMIRADTIGYGWINLDWGKLKGDSRT